MPLRRRRKTRHVDIGVCDEMQVWAISVDGVEPLVIGGTQEPAEVLLCAAANTLELSDRELRAEIV